MNACAADQPAGSASSWTRPPGTDPAPARHDALLRPEEPARPAAWIGQTVTSRPGESARRAGKPSKACPPRLTEAAHPWLRPIALAGPLLTSHRGSVPGADGAQERSICALACGSPASSPRAHTRRSGVTANQALVTLRDHPG